MLNRLTFGTGRWWGIAVAFAALVCTASARGQTKLELQDRWIYFATNLLVDKNVDEIEAIFKRAGAAGYNGVLLSDSKFGRLSQMEPRYFRNVDRVKKLAQNDGLEIIPALFPMGYSESLLSHDPNLAEGLPVKDALFEVHAGEARLVADPTVGLPNMTEFRKWGFHDENVAADAARGTVVMRADGKNARLSLKLKLHPFRQYHVAVQVKSQDFRGTPEVKVLGKDGMSLIYSNLGVKPTQDWTLHHAVFNTLDQGEVNVYFGAWGAASGTLWWKEAKLEEIGLVNLIRRDGAPLTIRRESDQALLTEDRDFAKLIDPKSGTVPWPGAFDIYHEPPIIKTTGLADGTRLRVSYYHVVTVYDGQVAACMSEPKTYELLKDEAKRLHAAFGAKAYFMSHDEIRVANWDEACQKRHLDAGEILADNVRRCTKILQEVNPGGRIYVWSDMFDPNHNAHDQYYLVRGNWAKSWEGLDPQTIIALWYREKRDDSLKFFADRHHPMIVAGYYDAPVENLRAWLDSAAKVGGVRGVIYTTWQHNYRDLEAFAKIINEYRK
jgi:hypothetical protein